jgi:hypothetical protein
MLDIAQKLWGRRKPDPSHGFRIERPLILIQSDDWGRVGVRDSEGYEQLRAAGIRLGEHPYDFYTLETADDVEDLHRLLKRHRDSTGRCACIGMNFVMANMDFDAMRKNRYKKLALLPLHRGLPGSWKRDGLTDAYRTGITAGTFSPSLHGLSHFCQIAIEHGRGNDSRSLLLEKFWRAETPYIYWRMPWVGYEYLNPEKPHAGFLPAEMQLSLIEEAAAIFKKMFGRSAVSACAPGYRGNNDTHEAWAKCGIRVVQNGSGSPLHPHMDDYELLNLHRTIDFEPGQKDLPLEKYLQLAENCFSRGIPAIISVHSINFHSSLKDFRTGTLHALDELLTALERKFPNLLYAHDMDVHDIVMRGKFRSSHGMVSVTARRAGAASGR